VKVEYGKDDDEVKSGIGDENEKVRDEEEEERVSHKRICLSERRMSQMGE
jgi:hypothetical protein